MKKDRRHALILSQLRVAGPMTTRQLGGSLYLDLTTMSQDCGALFRAGHVKREPAPYGTKGGKFVWALAEEQPA